MPRNASLKQEESNKKRPEKVKARKMLLLLFQGDFYFTIFYSPSSAFFLRIARLRFGFSSVAGEAT